MEEKPRKGGGWERSRRSTEHRESNQHSSVILQACYKCHIFFFSPQSLMENDFFPLKIENESKWV